MSMEAFDTNITYAGPSDVADEQWAGYTRARDAGHLKYVEEAKLFDRYYYGDQWEESVAKALDAENRPHTTVNLVLSTVNAVTGQYISQRQDIEYKPRARGATQNVSDALTKMAKHVSDDSHSRYVEKQVFLDGVIQDRGYFDMRLDFGENLLGEIRETALDPVDVLLDPGAREYDPKTWNEVYITRWMTPDEVAVMYGQENADKIRYVSADHTLGFDSMMFDPETFSTQKQFYTQGQFNYLYKDEYKKTLRVRIIERQFYKFALRKYFVDPATGDTSPVPEDWPPHLIDIAVQGYGLQIVTRAERRVRWRVTCDRYTFIDMWSPYRRLTVIPFFPYFRRGRPFGLVRNLIAPQDLTNKTLSQELHVVNTTANSGWLVEAGSLVNMTTQGLKRHGAKTGLVLEYNRGAAAPVKIQPNQIPTGLDRLSQKATMYFREISGVSDAVLGQPGREISGEALHAKTQRGLIQMDVIFDNLALTRQYRAEFMLELFQEYYTEQRMFKMVALDDEGGEISEELMINFRDAAGRIQNDVTLGEYSVVVGSKPTRDVQDETELQKMLSARELGVLIPDWAIVEAMGLQRGREIAQFIRKMQGAAEPTEQEIQMAQMSQELELRRQAAEVDEIASKVQLNLATAQNLMAQAQATAGEQQTEMVKFAAELRMNMEKQLADLQTKREELLTRIKIMEIKAGETRYTGQLQALTKRLATEAQERIEERKAQAAVATASSYGKSFNGGSK
jgi:hypothetical protein